MDVFSHAVYGYAVARWRGPKMGWLGALAGAAPDLLYGGAALLRRVYRQGWSGALNTSARDNAIWLKDGPPMPADLIADYNDFYRYTHSLVILLLISLLWYAIRRNPPWLMLAPLLHVVMDIPVHERYLTPMFFPLSDFTVVGVSWGKPPILIANMVALIAVMVTMYWKYWRGAGSQESEVRGGTA
ncbi:MAG TPA: hypothetical protein VD886_04500 [Herpetosiphonaceae bacterium]|nr:hypothetical protein [Herpetosiphonaceae bacterium]